MYKILMSARVPKFVRNLCYVERLNLSSSRECGSYTLFHHRGIVPSIVDEKIEISIIAISCSSDYMKWFW